MQLLIAHSRCACNTLLLSLHSFTAMTSLVCPQAERTTAVQAVKEELHQAKAACSAVEQQKKSIEVRLVAQQQIHDEVMRQAKVGTRSLVLPRCLSWLS